MGDVPSDTVNSSRGTEGNTPAPEPNVSNQTSGPGTSVTTQPTKPITDYQKPNSNYMARGRYGQTSPMNMNHMAYSLPSPQAQPSPFETHLVNPYAQVPPQGMMYPMQAMGQYPGQPPAVPYGMPYAPPAYPPYGPPQHPGTVQHGGAHYQSYVANRAVQGIGAGQSQVYGNAYYTHPYAATFGQATPMTSQVQAQAQPPQASRGPPPTNLKPKEDRRATELTYDVSKTIVDGSNPSKLVQAPSIADSASLPHTISTPGTPRGPPRKPKQSGHALWVGNLPSGANVMDLKDHFSQEATNDIESVFLISKSNCAFVNYKSASACAMALARFHDSRFQGVRLVCRLRKGLTVPGSGSTAPSSRRAEENPDLAPNDDMQPTSGDKTFSPPGDNTRSLDRYFIVKSLTVEDLELSKQSGIWATQTHNETNLNQAFETTDHVYLIFSANKSGEYFGYARMLSPINDDEELALEMPTRPEPLPSNVEELEVTPTSATSTAPKGRIIDDSARGTIFWEVESSEDEHDDACSEKNETPPEETEGEGQSFGKPFRIQWLSTTRLPFHRTRGLRNPWNANREVKIARDGTEIETSVGRKLLQLFHQV